MMKVKIFSIILHIMNISNFEFCILTFNINSTNINDDNKAIIQLDFSNFIKENIIADNENIIYFISIQEDQYDSVLWGNNLYFDKILELNNYSKIDKKTGSGNFYVHTLILLSNKYIKQFNDNLLFNNDIIIVHKKVNGIASKNTIITQINLFNVNLYLISSHLVIIKNIEEDTTKTLDAKKLNIPLITLDEFKQIYLI